LEERFGRCAIAAAKTFKEKTQMETRQQAAAAGYPKDITTAGGEKWTVYSKEQEADVLRTHGGYVKPAPAMARAGAAAPGLISARPIENTYTDVPLDGKHVITPVPFDAHEQIVRGPHSHTRLGGYKSAAPTVVLDEDGEVVSAQEYPKVIKRGDESWTVYGKDQEADVAKLPEFPKEILVGGERWTVYDAEQEKEVRAQHGAVKVS
jgi:hypothetical protein